MKSPTIARLFAITILAWVILMTGCAPAATASPTRAAAPTQALSTPRLRIKNTGAVDIQNLTVLFPESRIFFGDIPAGTTSDYQPAPKGVYNYAAYEYSVNGAIRMQPVTDWVGESPRPGQSYTYVLSFDPNRQNAQMIELVEVQADRN